MKHLLLTMTLLAAFTLNVNAEVITINETGSEYIGSVFQDYGQFHRDTTGSGLDWLNFSSLVDGEKDNITLTHSINSANLQYGPQGWRLPTYSEMTGLFDLFFPTYVGTDGRMYLDDFADPTSDLIEARNSWMFAFGTDAVTTINGSLADGDGLLHSLGMYMHDGQVQIAGITFEVNQDPLLESFIYGLDGDVNGALDLNSAYGNLGVFMVRTSPVPIPAAIWLFGSGLLALGAFARRKHK